MAKVTKDMNIMEVIQMDEGTADVFMSAGMGCLGCAAARFENLEQASMVHGIDVDDLVEKLNDYLENKEK
jgi:hybrid cluster-associated redox disulfide protein